MKVEIKVYLSELTDWERYNTVKCACRLRDEGIGKMMRNGKITNEEKIIIKEQMISEMKAAVIEGIKQRLVLDGDKLITWEEDVFNNEVCGKIEIVLPDGITRKDFEK